MPKAKIKTETTKTGKRVAVSPVDVPETKAVTAYVDYTNQKPFTEHLTKDKYKWYDDSSVIMVTVKDFDEVEDAMVSLYDIAFKTGYRGSFGVTIKQKQD